MEYLNDFSHLFILLFPLGHLNLRHFSARRPSTGESEFLVISNPKISARQYLMKRLRIAHKIPTVIKICKALVCRDRGLLKALHAVKSWEVILSSVVQEGLLLELGD